MLIYNSNLKKEDIKEIELIQSYGYNFINIVFIENVNVTIKLNPLLVNIDKINSNILDYELDKLIFLTVREVLQQAKQNQDKIKNAINIH